MDRTDIIKATYNKMQDEVSQRIYANRLLYNLTDDSCYMKKVIHSIKNYEDLYDLLKSHHNQKTILFGAGWWSSLPRWALPKFYDVELYCYADNYVKSGSTYLGLSVISFAELCDKYKNEYIIITAYGARQEVYEQLISNGFDKANILILADIVDEPVFKQYFDCPYIGHDEHEIFVDAGVFDGMTAKRFVAWSDGKYDHIYGFEPNASVFGQCEKKYAELNNATLFPKGIWDKETVLKFKENGPGSRIVEDASAVGSDTVPVLSLDDVLNGERVTFIKMDVEGAELKGLQGAENLIRTWKPKLAISVYHKPTDLWEIPQTILEYNPDYKFYMRHYFFNDCESLLYAF